MPIINRIPERLKAIMSMLKLLLRHNGFPGELGASIAGIGLAVLASLRWHPTELLAIRQLEPAVSSNVVHAILFLTSALHLTALLLHGRRFVTMRMGIAIMASRWAGCCVLAGYWACLMFGFWAAAPWHPIGILYCVMIYIYGYGGLFLFANRSNTRA
jgi:hypothetical protein